MFSIVGTEVRDHYRDGNTYVVEYYTFVTNNTHHVKLYYKFKHGSEWVGVDYTSYLKVPKRTGSKVVGIGDRLEIDASRRVPIAIKAVAFSNPQKQGAYGSTITRHDTLHLDQLFPE